MRTDYTLWFSSGSSPRVSLCALEECAADYSLVHVPIGQQANTSPAYLALNPKGKVPLLRTAQGLLSENIAIVSYLNARYPQAALLPTHNPWQQAQALSLMAWCASQLHATIYRLRRSERIHPDADAHVKVQQMALAELAPQLAVAEDLLAQQANQPHNAGPWLLGARWCMADTYLWWVWSRASTSGITPESLPRLRAHGLAVEQRAATQRALARESAASF